jgi:cytochrome c biogenesis protein
MKAFIDFFSSVKLAIFLLIIITLASILGTLVPQHRSPAEYASRYGQLSLILTRLQITRLYQSGWYITLLFLFAFNTMVCTLTRLSPKLKKAINPNIRIEKTNLKSLKIHDSFNVRGDTSQVKNDFLYVLRKGRFKIREKQEDHQFILHARKKILGIFGSDFVHLGIIIILLGGILSGVLGLRFNMTMSEGQTLPIPGADFQIRLDEFTTEFYPNGSVRDWKSTLTVVDDKKDILGRTIEVNHPLSYKGYVFYQSSYGFNWNNPVLNLKITGKNQENFQDNFALMIGGQVKLSDGITEIKAVRFVPDFVINENNEVASRSNQPNNPAVFIEGYQNGDRIFLGWIFSRFPDFTQIHSQQEIPFNIELIDVKGSEYSGLQIAKDPGANFIWAGSAVLMLGLLIAFYWPHKEIKVIVTQTKDGTEVIAGGIAAKNKDAFKDEFKRILNSSGSRT